MAELVKEYQKKDKRWEYYEGVIKEYTNSRKLKHHVPEEDIEIFLLVVDANSFGSYIAFFMGKHSFSSESTLISV